MFVALQLHERREKSLKWLLLFFVVTALLYGCHFVYFLRIDALSSVGDTLYTVCNLTVYPLFLMYVCSLTGHPHLPRWLPRLWLLLLPALVIGIIVGLLFALMSPEMVAQYVERFLYRNAMSGLTGLALFQAWVHVVEKVIFAVLVVVVLVVSWHQIREHDWYVHRNYADVEGKTLGNLRALMLLLAVTSVVSFVANIIGRHIFAESALLIIPSLLFSLLLLCVIYVGITIRIPETAAMHRSDEYTLADVSSPTQPETEPDAEEEESLKDRLMCVMRDEQLYLKHDLKIADLAKRLNTNRLYIYRAINEDLGTSFAGLVNSLRIAHALRLMRENPQMPVAEVAENSGYQSQASFFRNFKQICGCSPKNYRF